MAHVFAIIVIVLLICWVVGSALFLTRKRKEAKVKDILTELSTQGDGEIKIKMSAIERALITKLHIKSSKVRAVVWTIRLLFLGLAAVLYGVFGFMGICFCLAAVAYMLMDAQLKNQIEETGVNRIEDTVSFINAFTPQIASGKSAKQAFLSYTQSLPVESHTKELLQEYIEAKDSDDYSYVTPTFISEITTIYENALYNEEKGVNDYLYIIEEAKADLFQKSGYYNEYLTRCNEVLRPIEISYYIGIPVIFIALFGTFRDFWFTPWGAVAALIVLGLFLAFKFTINRLNVNTLHKIM